MVVPFSPTSEGSVWDIQLVTMAMVLSTAPIFSMGTLILPECAHSLPSDSPSPPMTCTLVFYTSALWSRIRAAETVGHTTQPLLLDA